MKTEERKLKQLGGRTQEIHSVKGTPFAVVEERGTDEHDNEYENYFVVCGNNRANNLTHLTLEEAMEDANTVDWTKIVTMMAVGMQEMRKVWGKELGAE